MNSTMCTPNPFAVLGQLSDTELECESADLSAPLSPAVRLSRAEWERRYQYYRDDDFDTVKRCQHRTYHLEYDEHCYLVYIPDDFINEDGDSFHDEASHRFGQLSYLLSDSPPGWNYCFTTPDSVEENERAEITQEIADIKAMMLEWGIPPDGLSEERLDSILTTERYRTPAMLNRAIDSEC